MRVVVALVNGRPEQRTDSAAALDGVERQAHDADHILVLLVGERNVPVRKGFGIRGVELEAKYVSV